MRIHDQDNDKTISTIILFLTMSEAKELRDTLECMIPNPNGHHHEHISSADYQKEVTVCIYDKENLDGFDEHSKKIILKDI